MSDQEMYQALLNRDSTFEGSFVAAIKTTGIFCRPTCRARKPKIENVEFFKTTRQAILKGYRPCKICKPMQNPDETPKEIQKLLVKIHNEPAIKYKDQDLRNLGIEPHNIRRWFLKNHRLTFHAYQRLNRLNRAFQRIKSGESVTRVAFECGFESLSGFNDSFKSVFGFSPSQSKAKEIINLMRIETPLGTMIACAVEQGLCLLEFSDRKLLETSLKQLARKFNSDILQGTNPHLETLKMQLDAYFEGKLQTFTVPLVTSGTAFQQNVWKALRKIPYGCTCSYQSIAKEIGQSKAVRAIANANGLNRIAIIIPCHRVIGADGSLTGYGGGLGRKEWLLDHESKNQVNNLHLTSSLQQFVN